MRDWNPSSWRLRPALQLPVYPHLGALQDAEARLSTIPPLIFPGEILQLRERLAAVSHGEAFLLQGGDCAENFNDAGQANVESTFRVIFSSPSRDLRTRRR